MTNCDLSPHPMKDF